MALKPFLFHRVLIPNLEWTVVVAYLEIEFPLDRYSNSVCIDTNIYIYIKFIYLYVPMV